MAETDNEEETEKKGGKMKFIIIGVVLLVLGVGGFFAAPVIKNMISPPPETAESEDAEPAVSSKPALFTPLLPPLVINFSDEFGKSHFMQITLEVMAREQSVIDEVKNHAAVIRNSLILMFGSVDYATVTTREGKEQMLAEALAEIQKIVEEETGETGVEAVYFTTFIVQ